jgi:endonuclease/exonuclease/phosphatase family metal-dependent hydrolase
MAAVIVLLYFAFTSPTVIARWTGASYPLVLIVLLLALGGFVWALSSWPVLIDRLTGVTLLIWNALFVLCLTLTILAHQVRFPLAPDGYPFASAPPTFCMLLVVSMLLLAPIVLVDFTLLAREIIAAKPSVRLLGGSFTLGALFILLMVFAQVFTTVYDYIPVVGPFFRDKFWLVFLADGAVLALSMLPVRKNRSGWAGAMSSSLPAACAAIIALGAAAGAWLTASRPPTSVQPAATLRVLTYNIQQGYNRDGQADIEGQLALMRQVDADIIGLQECDTTRVATGNIDVVRTFADRLNMYSYYGPNTTVGTFGIALLSKVPIQNPRTFYLYSLGEQTAAIEAQITTHGKTFNVYVTHLGNDGPIVQQEQVLQLVQGKQNVLLMGDFNFRPDTEQYRLTTTGMLGDAWLLARSQIAPSQPDELERRIDYLYVSPGIVIIEAQYLTGPQSDHPALVANIGL